MYWIFVVLVLALTLAVSRFRPAGIIGGVILAIMLVYGLMQRMSGGAAAGAPDGPQRGKPASAPVSVAFPLESLATEGLQLSGGGAPFELRGKIANRSGDTRLKSITFAITRRDCFAGALDPSGCEVLWDDRAWIEIAVPPGESRDFATPVWAHGTAPRARGTTKDEFRVTEASGEKIQVER